MSGIGSKKRRSTIRALERRQQFLENKLKTMSLLYRGRSYDVAENGALQYVLKKLKEEE